MHIYAVHLISIIINITRVDLLQLYILHINEKKP